MENKQEEQLKKLRELERQLTLIRADFQGYGEFMNRNIRQGKEIIAWENAFEDLIETMESLDYRTDTEKEREGLKQKIIRIIELAKPKKN